MLNRLSRATASQATERSGRKRPDTNERRELLSSSESICASVSGHDERCVIASTKMVRAGEMKMC